MLGRGLYKFLLLLILSSLQPGKLQEEQPTSSEESDADVAEVFDDIKSLLSIIKNNTDQLEGDLKSIREDLNSLKNLQLYNSIQSNLTHQLETFGSKLDTLYNQRFSCGGTGGWRRIAHLDMTNPSTTCPSGWQLTGYSKRTCGKATHTGNFICNSAIFPVNGGEYSRVCGRIKAYQFGGIDAFEAYNIRHGFTINDAYVSGISLTYGQPREHIWTLAAGATDGNPTTNWVCPCDATVNIRIPPFVNQDYFCETAIRGPWNHNNHHRRLFTADPLWDGNGCGSSSTCCEFNSPPYFTKQLSSPTTDNIEARICIHQPADDNVAVELLELFVQ